MAVKEVIVKKQFCDTCDAELKAKPTVFEANKSGPFFVSIDIGSNWHGYIFVCGSNCYDKWKLEHSKSGLTS